MATAENVFNVNTPSFHDTQLLDQIQQELHLLPPLVSPNEVNTLRTCLEKAFQGKGFIIQAGDCAERFSEAIQPVSELKCRQLVYLKSIIEDKLKMPAITIGRIAGQYAKPRSAATEIVDGQRVYSYHGDMMNGENLTGSRNPDPYRLLTAYHSSKTVLSHMATFGGSIYTSHGCFLLEYEKALTRSVQGIRYNLSTHLPWMGMRNIQSDVHINYLASIQNPVAIKIGANTPLSAMISAIQKINPENHAGKIILILRLGVSYVAEKLPILIQAIRDHNLNVIWAADPLHGNTRSDSYRKKYRLVPDAIEETVKMFEILQTTGIQPGGLHLETSWREDIRECVSSINELTEDRIYDSALDPRLNNSQCIQYLEQVMEKFNQFSTLHLDS